jgi:hypothetical protein
MNKSFNEIHLNKKNGLINRNKKRTINRYKT